MERASRALALLAAALLSLVGCGEEAQRGHDDPTPHGAVPVTGADTGAEDAG